MPVELAFTAEGSGAPVLLLHGFPENRRAWTHQITALAAAGFRVIAPDLRGYGDSPAPHGVKHYRLRLLCEDVVELIRREAGGRATVVGHDWGGVLTWLLAANWPGSVERIAVLNAPHPIAYAREVRKPGQALRSWYAGFFQIPGLPEMLLRAFDHALIRRVFDHGPARAGALSAAQIDNHVNALRARGSLSGAVNYYRAAARMPDRELIRATKRIAQPALVIWGAKDRYLSPELLHGLDQWVSDVRIVRLEHATHWLHHDEPERVSELLIDFLRQSDRAAEHAAGEGARPS
jgi:epoxide hydrolase 4